MYEIGKYIKSDQEVIMLVSIKEMVFFLKILLLFNIPLLLFVS